MDEQTLSVILVEPQLGQNIGAVARVMLNFGLTDLRLVKPRDGWPNPEAFPCAAGADKVLNNAQVFSSISAAVKDLHRVYATSCRLHNMIKAIYAPQAALQRLSVTARKGEKVGVIFGGERCGLSSEDISMCEALIKIPTRPDFPSLNLAHSVALVTYEWFKQTSSFPLEVLRTGRTRLATYESLSNFFDHLEGELEKTGFLRHEQKRPTMVRNLRNIFQRAQLTEQEVRTLRGVVRSLAEASSLEEQPEPVRAMN